VTELRSDAIGFPTALATAVGLIIAGSVLLTATTGFGIGGGTFALAVAIAFVLMLAQTVSFAELAGMIPTSASVYDYIRCGLGRFPAIAGTLAGYVVVHVFAGTAEVAIAGVFASVNFEAFSGMADGGSWKIGVGLVVFFAVVNGLGIDLYAKFEVAMTAFMWGTLCLFGIAGVVREPVADITGPFGASQVGTDLTSTLSLVGLALFLFVGCEFVTPLAAELKNPGRTIPRAMYLGVAAVCIAMFLYGAAVRRQIPDVALLETPMAIPIFAESIGGTMGRLWLGVAVLLASAATINTLLAGLPRILYGMALAGSLPRFFAYLHPRFETPIVAIGFVAIIPAIYAIVIDGNIERILHLVLAGVCAWVFAYVLVNLSLISLRLRRPDLPRPYRSPFFPVPQIVASLGMLVAIWYIAPAGMERRDIYIPFALVLGSMGIFALLWTLLVHREPLLRPTEPEDVIRASQAGGK